MDRRIVFAPPPRASLPDRLDLADAWQVDGGLIAFLGADPPGDAALLKSLDDYLDLAGNADVGIVWIEDPTAPLASWRAMPMHLANRYAGGATLAADAALALRNYALTFAKGCTLALDGENARIALNGAIAVAADTDAVHGLPIVPGPVTVDVADTGRLGCTLALRAGITPPDAGALDIGCRFYQENGTGIASLPFPLFDPAVAAFTLTGTLDPFAPLDPARTALAFDPAAGALASNYRTMDGLPVSLTPLAGSRLLFAERPGSTTPAGPAKLTLAPDGPFAPGFGAAADPRLRCGLSGTEYFTPPPGAPPAGPTLTFLAAQPAFASDANGGATAGLDSTALTSWVSLSAATAIGYWAQPDGAGLYGKADATRPNIVGFTAVPAGALPPGNTARFPLPPWAGVSTADAAACHRLEAGALAATRRRAVYDVSPRLAPPAALGAAADDTTAITPQGFVATFGSDGAWKQLTMAQHGAESLAFTGLADPLHATLLTGQQFVVVSDPAALGASFTATRITLDGWVFDLAPAGWAQHGTIAIIKNCPRPLRDLVAELGAWTLPAEMNANPAATQARLLAIIQDAEDARAVESTGITPRSGGVAGNDPDYAYFLDTVVNNAAWNGVLFLDAPAATDHSSKDLDAVLAATDPAKLKAHHFGVGRTPVTGTPPVMGESSFFGLIRYREDPAPPGVVAGVPQRFQVLELKALFHNSMMQSFSSRIALTLNQLFAAAATQRDSGSNALILVGSYQQRDDGPAYVFVQQVPSTFDLAGSALTAVEIDRAEFTATTGDGSDPDTVTAAFTFWGSLRFAAFHGSDGPLDLLSYDSLVFAGLVLGFQFPKAARTDQAFALDVAGVRFDAGASVTRPGGLAGHFPATVRGMLSADVAESPGALGFMTVGVSQLATSSLGSPWYALVFDLDLGTVGELVAEAGLISSLSLAWAPSRDQTRFAVGLKLPGSSGASSTIGIQGVLALNICSIDLVSDGGFALTLNGITLTFLKKKLPPGGSFDFYLFGDKDAAPGSRALGWYGAYKKAKDDTGAADAAALARQRAIAAHAWRRALAPPQP